MLYSGSLSKIPAPNQLLPIQTYVLLQKKVLQNTYAIMSLPVCTSFGHMEYCT